MADDWNTLTQQLVLRRMKSEKSRETGQPLVRVTLSCLTAATLHLQIELPARRMEIVEVVLAGAERDMYDTMLGCVK